MLSRTVPVISFAVFSRGADAKRIATVQAVDMPDAIEKAVKLLRLEAAKLVLMQR